MRKRATLGRGWRGLWSIVRPGYPGWLLAGLLGLALMVTASLCLQNPLLLLLLSEIAWLTVAMPFVRPPLCLDRRSRSLRHTSGGASPMALCG